MQVYDHERMKTHEMTFTLSLDDCLWAISRELRREVKPKQRRAVSRANAGGARVWTPGAAGICVS